MAGHIEATGKQRVCKLLGHVNQAYLEVNPEIGAPRLACWNKFKILEKSSDITHMFVQRVFAQVIRFYFHE